METIKIKEGSYKSIEDVIVEIKTTKKIEDVSTVEVSESTIRATIEVLNKKKSDLCAQIDEEIAINNSMLSKVTGIDRSSVII